MVQVNREKRDAPIPFYFRAENTIRERLRWPGEDSLSLEMGGEHEMRATFSGADDEAHTQCCVQGAWWVDAGDTKDISEWAQGRIPSRGTKPRGWPWDEHLKSDGSYGNLALPHSVLPDSARVLLKTASRTLAEGGRRAYGIIRWRAGELGLHDPVSSGRQEYSFDGKVWQSYPHDLATRAYVEGPPCVHERHVEEIRELASHGGSEPVCHALYREAWGQRHVNLRSALVLGVAAVEVGVKGAVAELMPDAKWLLQNMPAPPMTKILRSLVPQLRARATFKGQVLTPPLEILKTIQGGIEFRNTSVHVTGEAPHWEQVDEFLYAARDVLWLMDYYRGHVWALEHMRESTRTAMVGNAVG